VLKHFKKPLLAVVLFLCLTGAGFAAAGVILVASNIVNVNVQYTVSLSVSAANSVISLTARVKLNGNPAGSGINVDFYYSLNGGDWTYFATETTNSGGIARVRYTATSSGAYEFSAIARID
jgi:hypothetical protein